MSDKTPKELFVECRHAVFCKSQTGADDFHLVKEQVTYDDGAQKPRVRGINNYKRPFYVTKKGLRTYKDFKEWEKIENLDVFHCTQSKLTDSVARALGQPYFRGSLRDLCAAPYVFGVDISSTSLIKQSYAEKYPGRFTPYTVAPFDTETDMVHGHGEILMAGIFFKETMFIAIRESYFEGYADPHARVMQTLQRYLADVVAKRKITFEVQIVPTEIDVVKAAIGKAHEWKPDFLTAWNMEFDLDKIIAACARAGVAIEDIMSDPGVPADFRTFKFKKGPSKKVMASGRILNFKPSQRWHSVTCPSSFYWMDAMCAYRQVRTGSPEEVSYSLDYILKKNKLGGKLKFDFPETLEENGAEWHKLMQSKYPFEYVAYHAWDCISMTELDEKTRDLQMALPSFAGYTDFANFNSLPRKTMNDLHFYVGKLGRVPGSTASEMSNDMDEMTTDVKGWIVMLPSHLVADNGLRIIAENPLLRTNIRGAVADLDISAAYPTDEMVINISKETTVSELVSVDGIPEAVVRMQTINFACGRTNAVEFCTSMYNMPTMEQMLASFQQHLAQPAA